MSAHEPINMGKVARDLARNSERFCRNYFPNGRKTGNYWQMGNTDGAAGQSLAIRLTDKGGKRAGKWVDNATGEHGDLLDLLKCHIGHTDNKVLIDEAKGFLGQSTEQSSEADVIRSPNWDQRGHRSHTLAGMRLFSYGSPIRETLAEQYLRGRGISRFGTALSYHPNVYLRDDDGCRLEHPALLAAITNNAGAITGCSRIFLNANTGGLADIVAPKRVLGELYGNGIRFGTWRTASDLIIGEGLENTLSVGSVFPTAALISCLTANHLAALILPLQTKRIWIAHDDDDAGRRGACILQSQALGSGKQAFLLPPLHDDFNSNLQEDGPTVLRYRLAEAISSQVSDHDLWPYEKAA